jgi:hypothetical protein
VSFPIHGNSLHVAPCVRVFYYTVSLVPVLYQHGHIQRAEGVFAVTLFEYTLIFHGDRREKAEQVLTENQSVAFGGGPHARLEVTKDHDAALSADWVVKLICFDSLSTHIVGIGLPQIQTRRDRRD